VIESLRDRLLKRFPPELRPQVRLVRDVARLYPITQRAALAGGDSPALAFTSSGFVYYPPGSGATVRWLIVSPDASGVRWRFQIGDISQIATSAQAGSQSVQQVWAENPIQGVFESFQFAANAFTGPGQTSLAEAQIAYPELIVRPPNILMAALAGANAAAEWSCYVEEFVAGDEGS
jgi:hypothetical protein